MNRSWVVFSSAEIPIGTDFGAYLLKPNEVITLAFGQDIDRDGLFAREEFIYGSSDRMKDTDEDELGDFAEIRVGWTVKVPGRADLQVFPGATLADSDFDELGDEVEKECRTDPRTRDTDGDGLTDSEEIAFGRCCTDNTGQDCQGNPVVPCNPSQARNVVRNGDFDTGAGADADYWNRSHAAADRNRWTADPDPLFLGWDGRPGIFILNEVANEEPEVWQTISGLEDGAKYVVTGFYKTYALWVAGPSIAALVDDDVFWQGGHERIDDWESFSFEFTAAGDEAKLTFRGQVGSDSSYFIDGITVTGCSGRFSYCYVPGRSEVCWDEDDHDMPYPPARLDPRNPDTDGDSVPDGLELTLGSNPLNPRDADSFRDTDLDGLTDQEERDGWEVTVRSCSRPECDYSDSTVEYYSNPLEGDSDFDGLPDLLEYWGADGIPPGEYGDSGDATDPTADDTDCDGILDYDEFAEFGAYMNLTNVYPGFYLSGAGSQQLGTDPTSQDTDGDHLPDGFELYDGWRVIALGDDAPREVKSDPLFHDSDLDGLDDLAEYLGANGLPPGEDGAGYDATDPTDPDTDGDGRLDGREHDVGSDPLREDLFVRVTYTGIVPHSAPPDGRLVEPCSNVVRGHCCIDENGTNCALNPHSPAPSHIYTCDSDDDCSTLGIYSKCYMYTHCCKLWPPGEDTYWVCEPGWCGPGFENCPDGYTNCLPFDLGGVEPWDRSSYRDFWWKFYVKTPEDSFPGQLVSNTCDAPSFRYNYCVTASIGAAQEVTLLNPETGEPPFAGFALRPGESFQLYVHLEELWCCTRPYFKCPDFGNTSTAATVALVDQVVFTFEELSGAGPTTRFKEFVLTGQATHPGGDTSELIEVSIYAEIKIE